MTRSATLLFKKNINHFYRLSFASYNNFSDNILSINIFCVNIAFSKLKPFLQSRLDKPLLRNKIDASLLDNTRIRHNLFCQVDN
jgi:hypothetical protein